MTNRPNYPPSKSTAVASLCRFTNPGSSLQDTAIGLAMARDWSRPGDVQVELLMWFFSEDDSKHDIVCQYVALRIIHFAALSGLRTIGALLGNNPDEAVIS